MSTTNQSWRIPPEHYAAHPGQWAYLEFQAWAEKSEREGHLKPRQAPHIVQTFNQSIHTPNPRESLKDTLKESVRKGYITDGNRMKIQQKASEILHQKSTMQAHVPASAPQAAAAAPHPRPSSSSMDFVNKISDATLRKIRKDAPKVYRFLTDTSFAPDPDRDYDLHIEDTYGVLWLNPHVNPKDREFIDLLRRKYASDFDRIERHISDSRNRFRPDSFTRLANNNLASLFADARREPMIRDVLRDALAYLLS